MTYSGVPGHRPLIAAERHTPPLLARFLADLEQTEHSVDVWRLLTDLGQTLDLPCIDFICASSFQDWKRTLFIRTSYDSSWLNELNKDPEIGNWSYFRTHAMNHLTPITIGIEYIDQYIPLPERRVEVLRMAAERGARAGFSVPLRLVTPSQAALITYAGDHSRAAFDALLAKHGWTLNVAALVAHQRYMSHFVKEFSERNEISEKQRELLEAVGRGLQDKQIAFELSISISAVRQRMQGLLERTGLQTRVELAALAMSIGILPDPLHRPDAPAPDIQIEIDPSPAK